MLLDSAPPGGSWAYGGTIGGLSSAVIALWAWGQKQSNARIADRDAREAEAKEREIREARERELREARDREMAERMVTQLTQVAGLMDRLIDETRRAQRP